MDFSNKIEDGFNFLVNCFFFFGPTHFKRDFLCKIEGEFCFWSELFQINFKEIFYIKLKAKHFRRDFSYEIDRDLNFLVNFFFR